MRFRISFNSVEPLTSVRRSPTQMTSSSSPIARHLRFHFSSGESSPMPLRTKHPSASFDSLHLKPHCGVTVLDCRVSSISAVGASASSSSSSAWPSSPAAGEAFCRMRMMSLPTSVRACSRSSSTSPRAAQTPFGAAAAFRACGSVAAFALDEPTAASAFARFFRSLRSCLLLACSSALSAAPSPGSSGSGGAPDAMAAVTPMAPTACPASAGSSNDRSKKGSSRNDTLLQPQHNVTAQRWPRKLRETQCPQ
mmetsp:Transcript_48265/g.134154  ORF Transcript_48265/g.134154 Transcript_48265/m.134154 type:complete len:252 (+) Transcript_48265:507-1262(+)